MTIVLDAGHGGDDRGVVSECGIEEAALTYELADLISSMMRFSLPDERTVLTRTNDLYDPSLSARNEMATETHADLVVSIHANASAGSTQRGGLALHWMSNDHGRRVADQINRALPIKSITCNSPPATPTLWPRAHRVIRAFRATCVLVEVCYLDRPSEAAAISRWEMKEATALAIMTGIAIARDERLPF